MPFRRNAPSVADLVEAAVGKWPESKLLLDVPLEVAPGIGTNLTYAQVGREIERLAARFTCAGVQRGDRVAVLKRGNTDIFLISQSLTRIGAVPALISDSLDPASVQTMLRRIKPFFLVTDDATANHGALKGICLDDVAPMTLLVAPADVDAAVAVVISELDGDAPSPFDPQRGDSPSLILHSSGTTGVPKCVLHSANSVNKLALAGEHLATLVGLSLRSSDRVAACLSWVHVRAAVGALLGLKKGVAVLGLSRQEPESVLTSLVDFEPTVVEAHPNVFLRWESLADRPERPFQSARFFVSTADAIHPRTVKRLLNASDHRRARYVEVYGSTETGPATLNVISRKQANSPHPKHTVGRPLPGHSRARIVDPITRRSVARGVSGVVQLSTKSMFLEYVGERERSESAMSKKWFTTGDWGYRSLAGECHLLDREIDRVPGIASCIELEDAVMAELPELLEVVIVAGPDGSPLPVITLRDDQEFSSTRWAQAAERFGLGDPFVIDWKEIPMTGTWKVRRFLLQDAVRAGLERPSLSVKGD